MASSLGLSGAARSLKAKWDLAASFAVVCGVTGGLIQAGWYGEFSLDSTTAAWVGAGAGALAGAVMARKTSSPRSWPQLLLVVTSMALFAGIAVTCVAALDPFYGESRLSPALLGILAPLAAFVGLLYVLAGHRAALRPRPLSFLAHWARRRPWIAAATTCGAAAATAGQLQARLQVCALVVTGGAAITVFVAWRLDRRDARRLRSTTERLDRRVEEQEPDPTEWDLGEGDERWLCNAAVGAPYRAADRSGLVVRGNLLSSVRRLENAASLDLYILAFLLGAFSYLGLSKAPHHDVVREDLPVIGTSDPMPTNPPETPSSLTWYPDQTPILVDVDSDGIEDVIGLRWDNDHPEAALAISANDGKSLRVLWTTPRIPCQWASRQLHLTRSGDRLFLSDSEGLVHVYEVATGKIVGEAIHAVANETCVTDDAPGSVWIRDTDDWTRRDQGTKIDAAGRTTAAKRPKTCQPYEAPRPDGAKVDDKCSRRAPKQRYSISLVNKDVGVRLDSERDSAPLGSRVTGFDPITCRQTWQRPIAFTDDLFHREPQLTTELSPGRLVAFYQLNDGRWILGARDARNGNALWHREPPRAHFGTNFESLTVTSQRIYVCLNWRLEVFDPTTGDSVGVVW